MCMIGVARATAGTTASVATSNVVVTPFATMKTDVTFVNFAATDAKISVSSGPSGATIAVPFAMAKSVARRFVKTVVLTGNHIGPNVKATVARCAGTCVTGRAASVRH